MFSWYKRLANFEREIGMPGSVRIPATALLLGILSYVGSREHMFYQHDKLRREVGELRLRVVVKEKIDRDELSDLVINNRILLADRTDEGIKYRELRNSDIYRIK